MPTAIARGPWILWNTSESLPKGLYRRIDEPLHLGSIVAACLLEEVARVALERGYVQPGSRCPGGAAPLLKRVAAVEGMRVERQGERIATDGQPWPGGDIESHDSRGRRVPWQVAYPYVVAKGQVLLLGERVGSFDGRYFGPVSEGVVLGVYEPALIPSPSPAGERREPEAESDSRSGEGQVRPRPLSGEGRGEGFP
jgi:conjugative transfer signal peptidase TraF